jgi:hypothetical protein
MENHDNTLRLPVFHGMSRDDVEHNWFTCEAIWSMKRITNKALNIVQVETIFRDKPLTWYINFKANALVGQTRSLIETKRDILKEF